ncbi:DUF6769 family protein [Coprobacter sp.]
MKKKIFLPLLWLATFWMLLLTTVPHHHHFDGRICLHLTETTGNEQSCDITHHPDCEIDCLARFIANRISISNSDFQLNIPVTLPAGTVIFDFQPHNTDCELISTPFRDLGLSDFKESSSALRAPPCII